MRAIAHVTFDMRIGGAEQVIKNLVEHTNSSTYKVIILCLEETLGPFGLDLKNKGFQLLTFSRRPGFDISLIRKIRSFILKNNIDILHCHQYTPFVYGALSASFTNCKVLFTEHGRFFPDQRKAKRMVLNPMLLLFTDALTAISVATRDALVEFENFPKRDIQVIYNGIDNNKLQNASSSCQKHLRPLSIPEGTKVLGTVARLDSIKNQALMIRALKMVHKNFPDTVLIIVGDGPERANLETFTSRLDLSSKVFFVGFQEKPFSYYKIMDIFLLTSFSEGTAMTLLEAMASEIPCIATDVGGNPEIVIDGVTGFLIPSDTESALVDKISLLLSDSAFANAMGKNGRKRFDEHFTVEKMTREYEKIYARLVREKEF